MVKKNFLENDSFFNLNKIQKVQNFDEQTNKTPQKSQGHSFKCLPNYPEIICLVIQQRSQLESTNLITIDASIVLFNL